MQNHPPKSQSQGTHPGAGLSARGFDGAAAWRMTRAMAAAFSVMVALVMLLGYWRADAIDPLKSPELKSLKEELRLNPADENLKNRIRQADLGMRTRYFGRLAQSRSGVYLLLGGVVVFLVAAGKCASAARQAPAPQARTSAPDPAHAARLARRAVGAVGGVVGVGIALLSLGQGTALPERSDAGPQLASAETGPAGASTESVPDQELRQNWPRFRGPGGNGVSEATNPPSSWDPKTGAGIAWKVPVPAPGFNSPIIWGGRFFFSGGDASKREVFCYSCANGQPLWRQAVVNVPGSPATPPEIPETTGYAASSMATDGRRVYVIFATGDVAAFTLDGKLAWSKSFGPLKNPYGYASSLLTWKDRLIVLLDQGESEDGKSKLYALDGRTGQVVWQTPRQVGSSWATPISFESGGQAQVVALSVPWAIGYNLADGSELWRVECLSGEITPSAVAAAGLVFVPSPSDRLLAIRPDGHGDVAKTHVAWSTEENVPDVTSPVSNGELVFALTTTGVLTCFDARNGKKQWEHDFELEFHSSPSLAANRLYLFGQKGAAIITEAARQFKEVFRTDMPDAFHASPAFSLDKIILRGATNLWGLGSVTK